ncbi:MAG: hypothetical protein WC028_31700 [Candidatus Obscuribacterales bacterium]
MRHHVSHSQSHSRNHSPSSSDINALLVGPLVASVVDDLEAWREEDWKRIDRAEPESASELMRGIQLAINVGHAASVIASEATGELDIVHSQMLQELRNLRDCFAPGEEIRASAVRLRFQQKALVPLIEEHNAIALDAGQLFDELSARYNALLFPVRYGAPTAWQCN